METHILVAEPDESLRNICQSVIKNFPGAHASICPSGLEAWSTAHAVPKVDLLIAEAVMPELDGINLLVHLRAKFPSMQAVILTDYDLTDYAQYLGDATLLSKPFDAAALTSTLQKFLSAQAATTSEAPPAQDGSDASPAKNSSDLESALPPIPKAAPETSDQSRNPAQIRSGMKLGNYTVEAALPPSQWGPCFTAKQSGVNRDVRLTFFAPKSGLKQADFIAYFQRMAFNPHANLPTIFEVSQEHGFCFSAEEWWPYGDLSQWAEQGKKLDPREAASVCEKTLSALLHISSSPCRLMEARDLLLSPTGVLKLNHLHPRPEEAPAETAAQMKALAALIDKMLAHGDPKAAELKPMLRQMYAGTISAHKALEQIQHLVVALAPEKKLEKTREQLEFEKTLRQVESKKKKNLLAWIGGFFALSAVLGCYLWFTFQNEITGSDFNSSIQIPGGEWIDRKGEKNILEPFSIDEFEVTIFQYAQFLKAVEKDGMATYAPPGMPAEIKTFVPKDWKIIISSIQNGNLYKDGHLTGNSPVFNVDWFSASAYAKWKGKRLPTVEEWRKAFGCDEKHPFPWGEDADKSRANLGSDYFMGQPQNKSAGAVDGFHAWNPVNKTPKDRSQHGVCNLLGNVSEWTSSDGTLLGDPAKLFAGGNFASLNMMRADDPKMITSQYPIYQHVTLGFRCAADAKK